MKALFKEIRHNPLLWLLAFVPVGFSYQKVDLTTCVLDPDDGEPTVVLGVSLGF